MLLSAWKAVVGSRESLPSRSSNVGRRMWSLAREAFRLVRWEWNLGHHSRRCSGVSGWVGHHGQYGSCTMFSLFRCALRLVCPILKRVMAVSMGRHGEYVRWFWLGLVRYLPKLVCLSSAVRLEIQCLLLVCFRYVSESLRSGGLSVG